MGKVFLYQNVYEILPERIRKGIYVPGGKLPGDDILSDELKVSAITLKKAPEMLADSGYVRRGPVRGTYVREKEKEGTKGGKGGSGHMLGLALEHVSTPYGLEMMYQMDSRIIMPSHGKHYSPAILQLYLDDFLMVMIDKKLRGSDAKRMII